MPPVTADDEIGVDVERALRRFYAHAGDAISFLDQVDRLSLHAQTEARIAPAVTAKKIEKIPLRHQRDEFAARRQVAEIDEGELLSPERAAERARFRVRQLEEFIEQAELGHDLERRRMNGVAAKIAQEILVLLQHADIHAAAREQEAEHHPGGPAADDAATGIAHAPMRRSLAM